MFECFRSRCFNSRGGKSIEKFDIRNKPAPDCSGSLHAWFVCDALVFEATSGSFENQLAEQQNKMQLQRIDGYGACNKLIEYAYDLISGNVEEVIYQRGEMDEWRHKYHYDAANRLVRAWTSDDGEEWEMLVRRNAVKTETPNIFITSTAVYAVLKEVMIKYRELIMLILIRVG